MLRCSRGATVEGEWVVGAACWVRWGRARAMDGRAEERAACEGGGKSERKRSGCGRACARSRLALRAWVRVGRDHREWVEWVGDAWAAWAAWAARQSVCGLQPAAHPGLSRDHRRLPLASLRLSTSAKPRSNARAPPASRDTPPLRRALPPPGASHPLPPAWRAGVGRKQATIFMSCRPDQAQPCVAPKPHAPSPRRLSPQQPARQPPQPRASPRPSPSRAVTPTERTSTRRVTSAGRSWLGRACAYMRTRDAAVVVLGGDAASPPAARMQRAACSLHHHLHIPQCCATVGRPLACPLPPTSRAPTASCLSHGGRRCQGW